MYNNVVERCFRDCVESFRRKDLESGEERVSTASNAVFGHVCLTVLVGASEMAKALRLPSR